MKKCIDVAFWFSDKEADLDEYVPEVTMRKYYVDVEDTIIRNQGSEFQNDKIVVTNTIKVFADLYLRNNWPSILYVTIDGIRYDVASVKPTYPSLRIELGGVYNGEEQREPEQDT